MSFDIKTLKKLAYATLKIYKESFILASKQILSASPYALAWGAILLYVYPFALTILLSLFGSVGIGQNGSGILGGFIATISQTALYACIYPLIDSARKGRSTSLSKLLKNPKDVIELDSSVFWSILSVGFFIWIFNALTMPILQGFASGGNVLFTYLNISVQFLIAFTLHPLPEVLYLRKFDGLTSIGHCMSFVKENVIEWFLPFITLGLFLLSFSKLSGVSQLVPFVFGTDVFNSSNLLVVFLAQIVSSFFSISILNQVLFFLFYSFFWFWLMLFRAYLFIKLDESSRRKRIYLAS
jgi:hypothetical protein